MDEFIVVDSGKRQDFDTGSRRDTREGKGRFDLIPWPILNRLARHLEKGAAKYGDRNWEKGQPVCRYYDSAIRHLGEWFCGETTEDHLAAVLFNIMGIMFTLMMIQRGHLPSELDDRPLWAKEFFKDGTT